MPDSGFVRTVLGDVAPADLGPAYVHEHLILDSPLIAAEYPHIHLPSVAEAVAELATCHAAGLRTVVDTMPCAGGRDALRLAEVARLSGFHVVATTGLHTRRYYAAHPWTRNESPEELAARFVVDITEGIDRHDYSGETIERTNHRAGILKVATFSEQPDDAERRLFEAAVTAHRETGVPVLTHCESGRGALQQVALFSELGMDLSRVALSHTDKVTDLVYHLDILQSGAKIAYDQALRHASDDEPPTAVLIAAVVKAGFGSQVLLGNDGARRSLWSTLGGSPGLAWLRTGFGDALTRLGVDGATQERLFVDNPARYLTFTPV